MMSNHEQQLGRVTLPDGRTVWCRVDGDRAVVLDEAPWLSLAESGESHGLAGCTLRCPVAPTKILGIGKNYRDHASEMGGAVPAEPLVFSKLPSSLLDPGGVVLLPPESERVDYEGELAVVIGEQSRRVPVERALGRVFGYTIACDVTARDLQKSDNQWTRAKGFDTFCPLGPWIVTGVDPGDLGITLCVGSEVRQQGRTSSMVFDVAQLVSAVSDFCTLLPGDVLLTGTPAGVGPLSDGDQVEVQVDRLGALAFSVRREPA